MFESSYPYIFIAAGAAIGFILNKLRGSSWPFHGLGGIGAWLAAAGFAAIIAALTQQTLVAVLFAVAYLLGESIGWRKWITCIPGTMTQDYYNQNWAKDAPNTQDRGEWGESLVGLLVDEHKNYWAYCFLGMTLRGILWWTPVTGVFVWWFATLGGKGFSFDVFLTMGACGIGFVLALAVLFPLSYWFASRIAPQPSDYVGWAEGLYGAIYGAALSLVMMIMMIIVVLSHL